MILEKWQKIKADDFEVMASRIKAALAENQAVVYLAWDGSYELCRLVSGWDYVEVVDKLLIGAAVQGHQAKVIYGADYFCGCGQRVVRPDTPCPACRRQRLGSIRA